MTPLLVSYTDMMPMHPSFPLTCEIPVAEQGQRVSAPVTYNVGPTEELVGEVAGVDLSPTPSSNKMVATRGIQATLQLCNVLRLFRKMGDSKGLTPGGGGGSNKLERTERRP